MKNSVLVLALLSVPLAQAAPVVTCKEIQSGTMYPDGRTPKFFKINLAQTAEVKVGPVIGFEVKDQNDKVVADVAATITGSITKVVPFYETRETPVIPLGQQPYEVTRKVFAVQAYFKSTDYELDWNIGGDYRYPNKDMTRDLFCTSIESVNK
ncbi:MAG: hypothetical protein JST80_05490 [Bdellovibrionales bacterium]|nr:hypothetical protein [Bdellovibrionales bacterium]